jgi:hypothetical protein
MEAVHLAGASVRRRRLQASVGWQRLTEEGAFPITCWPPEVVRETSSFKQRWDLAIMVCILYSAMAVPFRMGFRAHAEGGVWLFEASMSLLFLADLLLTFNTAFLHEGEWVTSHAVRLEAAPRNGAPCSSALTTLLAPLRMAGDCQEVLLAMVLDRRSVFGAGRAP